MAHPLVVHYKKSTCDVYVGRPSPWGNPFVVGVDGTRREVIAAYQTWLLAQPELIERARRELCGKRLGCWCAPLACHGDVLAEIANATTSVGQQQELWNDLTASQS